MFFKNIIFDKLIGKFKIFHKGVNKWQDQKTRMN